MDGPPCVGPNPNGLLQRARAHLRSNSNIAWLFAMPAETASTATEWLFDSGATHHIHPNDDGTIPGSWRPDVPHLRLGDNSKLPVYGSVEKLVRPAGLQGKPLRRRVLIAPGVLTRVWSHASEVDVYGSTVVDSPSGIYIVLDDGRRIDATKTKSGLRVIRSCVERSHDSESTLMTISSGFTPPCALSIGDAASLAQECQIFHTTESTHFLTLVDGSFHFISGVGKPSISLRPLELLRLWHARLGHPPLATLLAAMSTFGVFRLPDDATKQQRANLAKDIRAAVFEYSRETCDICNACKQRRNSVSTTPRRPWTAADIAARSAGSVHRALRPLRRILLDIFGPVPYLSAQHAYRFLAGFTDEATSFRWVFGCKTHTAAVVEEITQLLRAALRLVLGEIDIIRMDNAPEFARADSWASFLADCGIFPEYSISYDARAMGRIERTWGIGGAGARCFLDQFGAGVRHWFSAIRHAVFCANSIRSEYTTIDGATVKSSASQRLFRREIEHRKLRSYGAPVRFLLAPAQRDSKFEQNASPGFYVGISPSNSSAMWVWDGHSHITVGGASIVDETKFIKPLIGSSNAFPLWPSPNVDSTPAVSSPAKAPAKPSVAKRPVSDVLPIGTVISVRYYNEATKAWQWYDASVDNDPKTHVSSRLVSTGRHHHYMRWHDKDPSWSPGDWLDLRSPLHVWKHVSDPGVLVNPAPVDPVVPPTGVVPPAPVTGGPKPAAVDPVTTDAVTGGHPSPSGPPEADAPRPTRSTRHSPMSRGHAGYSLRSRAASVNAILAAAIGTAGMFEQQRHEAQRIPAKLLSEAAELADVSDLDFDPADLDELIGSVSSSNDTPPASSPQEPQDTMPAMSHNPIHDAAAQLAVSCSHGLSDWQPLDERSIHDLRACGEVYVFQLDEMSSHPALLAAKARQVTSSRKTVVYYDSNGVAQAIEPKNVTEALRSLQSDQWIIAINVELENLKSHGAYHLVPISEPLSRGKKILRMTYVFKVKVHSDLSLDKFKARLCVVGSSMEHGSDYFESYASCARTTSVKLVVITTVIAGWIDFHFDLHGAFLTADIDADVYCYQPQLPDGEEERGPNGERMVWKLDKAIYGTVQAARLFTQKLRNALLAIGFTVSIDDDNVYRLDHKLGRIILSSHIDDGIGGASTQAVLDYFLAEIVKYGFAFSTAPGPWRTVLGFGLDRDKGKRSVTITARKHIKQLVSEHLASEAVSARVPTPDTKEIMSLEPPPPETPEQTAALEPMRKQARSLKGGLIYVSQVHPGIAHACSRVCSFMAKPTEQSYAAAKRILLWLRDRIDLGVTFGGPHIKSLDDLVPGELPRDPLDARRAPCLACTVDSDLNGRTLPTPAEAEACPPDSRASRSQLGYEFSIAGGCFDATSRRQHSIAVDTAAAELFAASTAAAQLINITGILRFITFGILGVHPVPMHCDNEICITVARDASSMKKVSYVARRVRLLQELVERKVINMVKVSGLANPADMLTKHLSKDIFRKYAANLYGAAIADV